ncbi:DUF2851 family protein [Cellulophaga baltica]|nr:MULTISPECIES: DUF2851 family protein [Cellulophaga]MBU2994946.1 DUF2851 family protein [Cellulophaga baltica]MDO6766341.1 DUF2851 family protein [Cellulophaga sp. 1_MG-2023]
MQEDFLHFIWKHKKLHNNRLHTTKNEDVEIVFQGNHNFLAGPDFFNAKLKIANQLWAGNVEIHIKSSDWYTHGHETDPNYDNVILHVVWEDDVAIFRKDNTEIPTLELKNYIVPNLLASYKKLFALQNRKFINCENDIKYVDAFVIQHWKDRMFFERLEQKSKIVEELLNKFNNDWEQVLFVMLLKNFGSKVNGASFYSLATNIDFSLLRKISNNAFELESLLFGLAGLLMDDEVADVYCQKLKKEYMYLKHKYDFDGSGVLKPEFFKLRPPNFPTIRLSQVASLYHKHQNLFSKIIKSKNLEEIYGLFDVATSDYWSTHYTFSKESKKSTKKLTKKFIDLLIINTILPLKFQYAKQHSKEVEEEVLNIVSNLKKEQNSIISNFEKAGVKISNAFESQAILQNYNVYCTKNKCLQCAVGNYLLKGND